MFFSTKYIYLKVSPLPPAPLMLGYLRFSVFDSFCWVMPMFGFDSLGYLAGWHGWLVGVVHVAMAGCSDGWLLSIFDSSGCFRFSIYD